MKCRHRRGVARAFLVALLALGACGGDPTPPSSESSPEPSEASTDATPWFEECAVASGVDFVWDSGHRDVFYMPEIGGGGAALFDAEGDGDLDLYLVQAGPIPAPGERGTSRLLANDGAGRFEDVTDKSGTAHRGFGMGAACGDFDGDGRTDLYVTNLEANALFHNLGELRFDEVGRASRADDASWGASAVFFDSDLDGDLDLFVANYLNWSVETQVDCYNDMSALDYCGPNSFDAPAMDTLLENDGDGLFSDVTRAAGMDAGFGHGQGVIASDFDGDGRLDLFVANDGRADQLWRNLGENRFADEGGDAKAGMGVTAADVDLDGDMDVLVCNLGGESDSFYLNQGSWFEDVTAAAGLGFATRRYTRFGMAWVDFDQDGLLDLYQANGKVADSGDALADDVYAEPNVLLRGTPLGGPPGLRFEEVLPRGGTRPVLLATSRGAAFGDVDGDLDTDVVVVNKDGRAHLLRNVAAERSGGNAIVLRVLERSGAPALNAQVSFSLEGRRLVREVQASYSFMTSNDPRIHVGLGTAEGIGDVEVRWTDGTTRSFGELAAGSVVDLRPE